MSDALFEARGLCFRYEPGRPILDGIDLRIDKGDFIGLIGPNGAGKSTLLRLLTGWLKPASGELGYRGRPLAEWPRRLFAREVGVVPQSEEGVFPFTVEEIVLMGRYAHQGALVGFDDPEDRAIVRNVLGLVGLEGFAGRPIGRLSGGERQRVLLARALAQCPSVLLLDEPTASLDLHSQREVFALLEKLNREQGLTILAITHDINLAAMFSRRVIVLADHHLVADGPPESIFNEELLSSVYRVPVEVICTRQGHPHVALQR